MEVPAPDAPIGKDDDAIIVYTSGSTARSKGVVSTHRAILHAILGWECEAAVIVQIIPKAFEVEGQAATMLTSPLFHMSGLVGQCVASLRCGRKVIIMNPWDAERALDLIGKERITKFTGVPAMSWELINSPTFETRDVSSLRIISGGGVAVPPSQIRMIAEKVPHATVATGWGMTETNGLGTGIGGSMLLANPMTCGRAIPRIVQLRVVDDQGAELPRGHTGDIVMRSVVVTRGYWNQPDVTAAAFLDGWLITGDIGYMDDEDLVYITGRKRDMVKRGQYNVTTIGPAEIEAVLYDHPATKECCVFGIPAPKTGELLVAAVAVKDASYAHITEQDMKDHVAAHLAPYKVPDRIAVTVEPLPKLASGKISKNAVRETAIRDFTA